jgi:hypothetical protein
LGRKQRVSDRGGTANQPFSTLLSTCNPPGYRFPLVGKEIVGNKIELPVLTKNNKFSFNVFAQRFKHFESTYSNYSSAV